MVNQATTDTTAVEQVVKKLANAWNSHNEKDLAKLFREDGEFTDVSGQLMRGRAEIEQLHQHPFTTTLKHAILSIKDVRITWITPTSASVDVHWTTTGHQTPAEQSLPARNGLMNLIIVQEQDQWLIAIGHSFDFTATYRRSDFGKA
ncbi:SgcJ/EcaC family oxidoreductase [Dictyobacter formicarum]|uniref:DUF4440 domain-containing protein n=1 Tax=Dictyobacter formicarum TaxID=2778368 RepID=A0ABQ3VC42_9CHLR|nr:SgcJ/EcaC family oxidoreductase [Dictyobacter formicarum]GHO83530.1 hypothetical protein KSZ_15360 [Dictyobacter formicarum]